MFTRVLTLHRVLFSTQFRAPLLSSDSSSPALYVKFLEVATTGHTHSLNHPFFVLKVGSTFTVTPPLGSPELHSSEFRLATMYSAGQLVPRISEFYLYGYKASKVRLMGIGRFSVDRVMQSIQSGVEIIQVSVGLIQRKGRVATTVLLALRSDECPRAIPYAVVNGVDEKLSEVQDTMHESGGPESQYLVISSGGDMAIGVVEDDNKVDGLKRT